MIALYTSIQILPQTRQKLAQLKEGPRETYDNVLNKLVELVPARDDEGEFTDEFRIGLLNARLELKRGGAIGHGELKKRLGL
ncbi:hypothetical protein HY095_03375 [Candidatus Micrarchaeota archaeon]|nr:hypothetical protein [Candidatus Micrarchaeota archaeon]